MEQQRRIETSAVAAEYAAQRAQMVETQLVRRQIHDQRVLAAMRDVPRHEFVPECFRTQAYEDSPIALGYDQTISQPFIVAYMLQQLKLAGKESVLEIGAGSGYQTAVLAELCRQVYALEIIPALATQAAEMMKALQITNVAIRCGDGYLGWPEFAPFDRIILAAAPGHVPSALVSQLRNGGRMILPLGFFDQQLLLLRKSTSGKVLQQQLAPVKFVPMTGLAEKVN